MTDHKNISSYNDISEQQLLDYINNKLSQKERNDVELKMTESNFVHDAIEGLGNFNNKKNIEQVVHELNHHLHKQTGIKKHRKHRRKMNEQGLIIVAIIVILLLIMFGYFVIKELR